MNVPLPPATAAPAVEHFDTVSSVVRFVRGR